MADVNGEDIERLASRLAMMASEEGEAANAGRAVAQLARRLGLTGGELKEMFLSGAASRPPPLPGADIERFEREISTLRKSLRLVEGNCRDLEAERDALIREVEALRARMETAHSSSQIRFILTGVVALALAGAGAVGWLMALGDGARPTPLAASAPLVVPGPVSRPSGAGADFGTVTRRVGVVRSPRAVAYRQPDRAAPAVATLQQGMPVVVRRVFMNLTVEWAEIEVGSTLAYVEMADLDLS